MQMQCRKILLSLAILTIVGAPAAAQSIKSLQGHQAAVSAVAFRPDGRRLASASFDHTIKVWDVATGLAVRTFNGHEDKVLTLAYSADGSRLASAGQDGTIRLWNVDGKECVRLATPETCVQGLAFTPDGGR